MLKGFMFEENYSEQAMVNAFLNYLKLDQQSIDILLKEILKIEQSNNNIIKSQLQSLLDEKKNINLNKKVAKIYHSTSMRYFNEASSSSNLNKVL